jgi:hypothetical protein
MTRTFRIELAVFLLDLAAGACGGVDGAGASTTSTAAPTTTAPATSQDVLLTFDGEHCTYEGLSDGVLSEPLAVKLINNSDVVARGAVIWVSPDLLEEVIPTVGTDFPFSARTAGITNTFYIEAQRGTEASTGAFVSTPGTYVLDCLSAEGATPVHVWRPAAIEFSP